MIETRAGAGVEALRQPALVDLIETAWYGFAVLDAGRRYIYVNRAAGRLLGSTPTELTGSVAPFPPVDAAGEDDTLVICAADGRERELGFTENTVGTGAEQRSSVVFWDVTAARRRERRLATFARTASTLVDEGSMQNVLDKVAAAVLAPTGAVACALVLIDPETHAFVMAGTAGHGDEYLRRMEESRRLGAPLLTLQVYESRRPVLRRDVADLVTDPRFEPMRDLVLEARWRSVIGVPLVARDAELGSLTTFYPASYDPDDDDISFLTAMAEQAAVAVENARLLAAVQDKGALEERHRLARDLHDSVSQALFSMNLQARALEMALEQAGGDPAGRVARGLAELRTLTQGALAEMRALIFQLRPEALHEEGLVAAVRKHAAAVTAREGVRIAVHAEADRLPLAEPTEAELFRVVQEAVHNSVKHGHPDQVDIWVNPDPDAPSTLVVEIGDDGVGFDPDVPHPGHLGLDSMRERTERLGGRLLIDSSDAGSRVRAVCPALLPPAAGVGQ
jgi:signal transduction histidine kinase